MSAGHGLMWIQEDPKRKGRPAASSATAAVAGIRPRRAHTKSRQGCSACKRRRKKCDEARPTCGLCQHMRTRCDYVSTYRDPKHALALSHGRSQYSMSRQTARTEILRVLRITQEEKLPLHQSQHEYVDSLHLLDHFLTDNTHWVGSPHCQKILQQHGIQMGLEAPHLLHGIMAFAASHIDYLHPDPMFRVTAVHHYDRLLVLYASQMHQLSTENVNSLFGACTLLTMLSYLGVAYDNPNPNADPEGHHCDWDAFRSLQGTRVLQTVPGLRDHLTQSVWRPAIQESEQWEKEIGMGSIVGCHQSWSLRVMEDLCALCDVSPDLEMSDNIYLDPLRRLNNMIYREMDEANTSQLMHFVASLSPGFMNVLEQLDNKALLIVCYWKCLLLQTGQWWIVQTAIGACRRMCTHLWRVGGDQIRRLLLFPAARCGLDLDSLDYGQATKR